MASKEAPKITHNLYMGQRLEPRNVVLGITNTVDKRLQNECKQFYVEMKKDLSNSKIMLKILTSTNMK